MTSQYLLDRGFAFFAFPPEEEAIAMEEEEVDEALPLTVAGVERSEVYEAENGEQYVKNPVFSRVFLVAI
jgi:hypothetical protein